MQKEVTEYKWVVEYNETKGKRYKKYIKVEKPKRKSTEVNIRSL